MNVVTPHHRAFAKTILALVVGCALFAGASALGSARPSGPIESGAGPGWPATLSPTDFVAHVDNRWFPLLAGSRWRYRGVKDGREMVDVVKVTGARKRILGVAT